jgi:hypothetical protein
MTRQRLVGWVLVAFSAAYILYFVKVRLFEPGPLIERREWLQVIGTLVTLMLGTINIRLAARNEAARHAPIRK